MQFHILSFEGPDPYSRAGGLATRVDGLAHSLSALGFEAHLWFIGDPAGPGEERLGNRHLHPAVIPNGLPGDAFDPPDRAAVGELRRRFRDRMVVVKMARRARGLHRVDRQWRQSGARGLLDALGDLDGADLVDLRSSACMAACASGPRTGTRSAGPVGPPRAVSPGARSSSACCCRAPSSPRSPDVHPLEWMA